MYYDEKKGWKPGQSGLLHRLTPIGHVLKSDHDSGRITAILSALPTPTKQQGINFWEKDPVTNRYEITWTKENGELYGPGEQRRPIFKCNEWTAQHAIPALQRAGILRPWS
ncbi:hypothetical protein CB0940_05450 [Cercospora beticola]|uniref:Uncharacterized protein n=1 Tax=Cercospora beticola TaxID=122368 RepID=A0A2G5HY97_CERBT|nr:hypothetical protein CB0940_05450 [Cercospora beticola]PIA97515.1 hypothetical protein CB0940_05450 [Cercospora beticola]WPA97997.1 hypothetical protein RHO25_002608 [Cercospora beticola]CAK1359202.1 unnamed protein product [Cercospora beticola]